MYNTYNKIHYVYIYTHISVAVKTPNPVKLTLTQGKSALVLVTYKKNLLKALVKTQIT